MDLEAVGGAALLGHAAGDLGRAVRRAVVDEDDPLDGAEKRRQDPGQRVGLVLGADDCGEARRRRPLRPAPDDVEVVWFSRFVSTGEFACPTLARGAVARAARSRDWTRRRDAVKLPDAVVLFDRVSQDRAAAERPPRSIPLCVRVRRGGLRRRSRSARSPPHTGEQDVRGLVVVTAGRKRQRRAVLAPRLRRPDGRGRRARDRSASVSSSCSIRPTWSSGSCVGRSCWTAQWTSSTSPPGERRRRSGGNPRRSRAGCSGRRGNHGSSPNIVDEARLAQEELGLPGRPEARRRVPHDGEAKPAVSSSNSLALLALVVGETVPASAQRLMSWMVRDGETSGSVECAKRSMESRPARRGASRGVQPDLGTGRKRTRSSARTIVLCSTWLGKPLLGSATSAGLRRSILSVTLTSRGCRRRSLCKPPVPTGEGAWPSCQAPLDNLPIRATDGHL